jgi:hypothetical protein
LNPKKAYNLKKTCDKKFFLLLLVLILQLILYFNKDSYFKIPNFFVNHFQQNYLPQTNLSVSDIFINPNKTLTLEYLSGETNAIAYKIESATLKLYKFSNLNINNFKKISIKKIELSILNYFFSIEDLHLTNESNKISYNFNFLSTYSAIKCNGTINKEILINFLKNKKDKDKKYNQIFNKLDEFVKSHQSKFDSEENLINILVNCNIDEDVIFHAFQLEPVRNNKQFFTGLNSSIKFPLYNPSKIIATLFIKNQNIFFRNMNVNIKNLSIKRRKSLNNESGPSYLYLISNEKFEISGNINGDVNGINIYIEEKNDEINTSIITDSNQTEISTELSFDQLSNSFSLSGVSQFYPDNFNLFLNNNLNRKIIKGDKVRISLKKKIGIVSLIDFNAFNFSVLESPYGNFEGNGILDNNFSVKFSKSLAMMGNSLVKGSFQQNFFPHRYSFNIAGNCEPNDLNNWMGDWWGNLWSEFDFRKSSIPYGDFKINGTWGASNDFFLMGTVKTKDITFRNLKLNQVELTVNVDENSTSISTPEITHDFGNISGSIKIPRGNNKKDTLTYRLDGNFPVNDGVKVFGSELEDYINDFNTSDINIISHGSIPLKSNDSNETSTVNSAAYEINFSTDKNGSWNGIKYNMIRGKILSLDNNFSIQIPQMIIENSELSLKSNFHEMDKYSLTFNLKDAPSDIILNSLVNYQNSTQQSILPSSFDYHNKLTGKINLSFNGQGNLLDFSSLKGSGKISVIDKNLRQIQLLGTLSESLNILPIPLPIGTLNFNELSGYFNLENDKIYFDKLILTSLLSKLTSKGYINFNSGIINFTSNLNLIGNLIPFVDKIDPFSIISDIKLSGHWQNPNWKIQLSEIK